MPAIDLARLRRQAAELVNYYEQPKALVSELDTLFEYYADRTHRPSRLGSPDPLIKSHKVPRPVMRRILFELGEAAQANPEATIELVEAFWAQPVMEFRSLAAILLGKIPPAPLERLTTLLQSWSKENEEDSLLEIMASESLIRLRNEERQQFIDLIDTWLSSPEIANTKLGLRALLGLLQESNFDNLPVVYRLLGPLAESAPAELRPYLLDLIRPLARRSPQETAYFLRQSKTKSNHPTPAWLIRHSLNEFSSELQKSLRAAQQN